MTYIKDIKKAQLLENWNLAEGDISFPEFVRQEAYSDPNFFRWLFDEDFENDFHSSLSDDQHLQYDAFLKRIS